MNEHCLGVVLAGGAGLRVGGADKGLLPLCGRPLIERVLDALRSQCDEMLIVANRNSDAYARYATVIGDEIDGHPGPLAGIATAFARISLPGVDLETTFAPSVAPGARSGRAQNREVSRVSTSRSCAPLRSTRTVLEMGPALLTVPVDCPQPPCDVAVRLRHVMRDTPDVACAFAHDGRGAQPLFALYRLARVESLLATARAALTSHASVLCWHGEIGARAVDFSDCATAFHNLNTPQDFDEYERRHGER